MGIYGSGGKTLRQRLVDERPAVVLDAQLELQLLLRDRVVEEGDCLLWTGNVSDSGAPRLWVDGKADVLRRLLWVAKYGIEPEADERIGCGCGIHGCIEHLKKRTRSEELRDIRRDAAFKSKIAATKRAASKINAEIVAELRASDDSNVAAGKRIGINHQTVARIRRHEIWKAYATPFAGLGAR